MRYSLNFIKEFFSPEKSARQIGDLITMAGLEVEHLEKKGGDWIFDVEITSNRSDWLSVFGVAHEIACLCGRRLSVKFPPRRSEKWKERDIIIENLNDCPIYTARIIEGVKVENSPEWLKERLINSNLSTINNVVDITNYCMLKWGNPLHAFDRDKIEGAIYIRRARKGEVFVGLDEKERLLDEECLVISDEKKVIALAGVMGAKNTEVDYNTRNILLETAVFSPVVVRRSRRKVGLDTDASYRFERKVSSELLEVASYEAASLMSKLCGGTIGGYKHVGERSFVPVKKIRFSFSRLNRYIGISFPPAEVKKILKNLGFNILPSRSKDTLILQPPFFRTDIKGEVDVFEEVSRIYGYNRIKDTLPVIPPSLQKDETYIFKRRVRNFLVDVGLKEVITYSANNEENLKVLGEKNYIRITNPLRSQENALRPSLLAGMLEVVRYNINQKNRALRFFEIANTYRRSNEGVEENPFLSLAVTESGGGFLYLKGVVEEIMKFLNASDIAFKEGKSLSCLNALVVTSGNHTLGFLGKVNSHILERFDVKEPLYFAQFDIEKMRSVQRARFYRPFSRYPAVYRDVSIKMTDEVKFEEIKEILEGIASDKLAGVILVDVYKGKDLKPGEKAFTLRIFYQSHDRTLSSEEVDKMHNTFRETLAQKQGIVLR